MNPEIKDTVGVLAGDSFSIMWAAEAWAGRSLESLKSGQRIAGPEGELFFLGTRPNDLESWPGGTLFWFLPDHGPSRFDLLDIGRFLEAHARLIPRLVLTVVLAKDSSESGTDDLADYILETIPSILPETLEAEYRAVLCDSDTELKNFLTEVTSS